MPLSALPEHLNSKEEIENAFPDDSQFLKFGWIGRAFKRIKKYTKAWFAFGPRATEWWAKWRELPITVFAVFGDGPSRWENSDGSVSHGSEYPKMLRMYRPWTLYLSAIQYWSKWHFQIQWPLFIAFHYYFDEVPAYPEKYRGKRVLYFRFGSRRDADRVYWFPSLFIGLSWN